jgi:hypothetical protein
MGELCYSPADLDVGWVVCDMDTNLQNLLPVRLMSQKPQPVKKSF